VLKNWAGSVESLLLVEPDRTGVCLEGLRIYLEEALSMVRTFSVSIYAARYHAARRPFNSEDDGLGSNWQMVLQ